MTTLTRNRFLITLLLSVIEVFNLSTLKAQTYNEILGRPTNTSITISILFDKQAEVYWEYGTGSTAYTNTTAIYTASKAIPLKVEFTNLLPNQKYYYRTRYRPSGLKSSFLSGPEHTFQTQRSPGSTFSFTVESDEHLYDIKGVTNLYKICLSNQAADNPDFMFTLGDIFGDDHYPTTITHAQMDSLHKYYRPLLGNICHSVPLYICLGNHEGETDYYLAQTPPNNIAVYATLSRKLYYPNPYPNEFYSGNTDVEPNGIGNPENYYSFTWGDALFVVLDVYRDQCDTSSKPTNWNWSLGLPQYTWLKNTLENSTSKFKFVFAHHIRGQGRGGITNAKLYEWGGYEQNGTTYSFPVKRPGWEKPIHKLFVDNGVTIFFQGHDHLFAREVLDGVIYQEVPMPSDSTYKLGMKANAKAYVSDTLGGSGHLKVTVSPSCTKVDFVRAYLPVDTLAGIHKNREVAFSYSIGNCQTAGTNEELHKKTIKIFPNPAKDVINITIPENEYRISISNALGQEVIQTRSNIINVSGLKNGPYIVKLSSASSEVNKKIMICR